MVALTVGIISITQKDNYAICKASSSTSAGHAQAALVISDSSTCSRSRCNESTKEYFHEYSIG